MSFILMSIIIQAVATALYVVSFWASITNRSIEKQSSYECGLEPISDARMKFDVLYYVIGILYLIFDLEIIFLFPIATIMFTLNSLIALWVVMAFLIILTIGFIYEYNQGALDLVLSGFIFLNYLIFFNSNIWAYILVYKGFLYKSLL